MAQTTNQRVNEVDIRITSCATNKRLHEGICHSTKHSDWDSTAFSWRLLGLSIDIPWLCDTVHDCGELALPWVLIHYDRVISQMTHQTWIISARASLCRSWKKNHETVTTVSQKKSRKRQEKKRKEKARRKQLSLLLFQSAKARIRDDKDNRFSILIQQEADAILESSYDRHGYSKHWVRFILRLKLCIDIPCQPKLLSPPRESILNHD